MYKQPLIRSSSTLTSQYRFSQRQTVTRQKSRLAKVLGPMMTAQQRLDISGIIAAIPTPFKQDGSVDYDALAINVGRWERVPLRGYCVGGSNGEGPCLKAEEKLEMVSKMRSMIGKDRLLIAGTGCESTKLTCDLSNAVADAGADGVMVLSPFYYKSSMTEDSLYKHFVSVADLCPVPIIVYNNVSVTGIDLSVSVLKKMASHPNIVGVKDKDMGKLAALVTETRDQDFQVVSGGAGYLLAALLVGCSGGLNELSSVLGEPVCEMYELARAGQWEKALVLQRKLVHIDALLTHECAPAGIKAAMDLLGYRGGIPRAPLTPISGEKLKKIEWRLKADGFL